MISIYLLHFLISCFRAFVVFLEKKSHEGTKKNEKNAEKAFPLREIS